MPFDAHANLAESLVLVAPVTPAGGTSLTVHLGEGAIFDATPPFNCECHNPKIRQRRSNTEIVRVTDINGDVLTIIRAQEGTTAQTIAVGWRIAIVPTKKTFTDIEEAIDALGSSVALVNNTHVYFTIPAGGYLKVAGAKVNSLP